MNLLHKSLLPVALCLTIVASVRADDDKKGDGDKDKDKMSGKMVTVHGVISAFTVVGETDLDRSTGKLTTASATLVTVIGHPWMHEGEYKENSAATEKSDGKEHASHHHRRMNLYVAAMTPKTKVNEVMASGKVVALDDKDAKYDDLEIGDRVELTINVKDMDNNKDEHKSDAKSDGDAKKVTMSKHGRHRTFLGSAVEVKLMPEHMEGTPHDGKSEHKEESK